MVLVVVLAAAAVAIGISRPAVHRLTVDCVIDSPGAEDLEIELKLKNGSADDLEQIYFVLSVLGRTGAVLGTSLSSPRDITGPWIGFYDWNGKCVYTGEEPRGSGNPVLTYTVKARRTMRCRFFLNRRFVEAHGEPKGLRIEARNLSDDDLLAAGSADIPSLALRSLFSRSLWMPSAGSFRNPLLYASAVPLLLAGLCLVPSFRRRARKSFRERPPAGPLGAKLELALATLLVLASTAYFLHANRRFPPTRDPDSFEYLATAERFGVDLTACVDGIDDRGYDRRAFLHQVPDRSWGYPLLIAAVARFSGNPSKDRGPLLRNLRFLQVGMLLASCLAVAWITVRCWLPSRFPLVRAALAFLLLLLQSYNFRCANAILSEVASRFLFVGWLSFACLFLFGKSPRTRRLAIAAAFLCALGAMLVRPEHLLTEVAGLPILILAGSRPGERLGNIRSWAALMLFGLAVVAGVSYATFRTPRFCTSTGFHLLNVIQRIPDGNPVTVDIPSGLVLTEPEKEFFARVILPAGCSRGGLSNPWVAVPAFLGPKNPLETSAQMDRFSLQVLVRNWKLWLRSTVIRFSRLASSATTPYNEAPLQIQRLSDPLGFRRPLWSWPFCILLWVVGRRILERRIELAGGHAGCICGLVAAVLYSYMFVACATEIGEGRTRFFASGLIPMLGLLVTLDALEILGTLAAGSCRRTRGFTPVAGQGRPGTKLGVTPSTRSG
jgi:hypothetical protein